MQEESHFISEQQWLSVTTSPGTEFYLPGRTALQLKQCHSVHVPSCHGAVNRDLNPQSRYGLQDRVRAPAGSVLELLSCAEHPRAPGHFPTTPTAEGTMDRPPRPLPEEG